MTDKLREKLINGGRVLACDTPANLKQRLQSGSIFRLETTPLDGVGTSTLAKIPGVRKVTCKERDGRALLELILEEEQVVGAVIVALEASRIGLLSLTKHLPTLEDVFVELVGRSMEEVEFVGEPPTV